MDDKTPEENFKIVVDIEEVSCLYSTSDGYCLIYGDSVTDKSCTECVYKDREWSHCDV